MTYNKRDIKRLLRTAFGGPRNDRYGECGAECGERPVLSTKYGESLPLRHFFSKRSRNQSGTLLFCPPPYVFRRQSTPALIRHHQLSSGIKSTKNASSVLKVWCKFLLTKRQKMTTIVVKKDYDDTIRHIYPEIENPFLHS